MKRSLLLSIVGSMMACLCVAQNPEPQLLYPDGKMPGNNEIDPKNFLDNEEIRAGITVPDYTLFLPDPQKATGQCIIVCPGGGYGCVCYAREGNEVARWLNENGIAAIVLRYRMPNGHHQIPIADYAQAMKTAREHAEQWGINPHQIGVMGFSAGGHIASTAVVLTDEAVKPDFAVLIYPVITMDGPYAQIDTRNNLLGTNPDSTLIEKYSAEKQITPETSPCFIALSNDDDLVHPRNSTLFYDSLRAKGVSAELHIYPTGQHGWNQTFVYWDEYHTSLLRWLKQQREHALLPIKQE